MTGPVTLLASAALAFGAAAAYAFVGARTRERSVSEPARLAARLFATWWYGLALVTALGGVRLVLAYAGVRDAALYATLAHASLAILVGALWGLLFYLAYLFTGRRGLLAPVSAFYAAYYVLLVYFVVAGGPTDVVVERWRVRTTYATPPGAGLTGLVGALLLAPPMLGALGYFALLFRAPDRTARYRVAVVSGTFVLWFGAAGAAWLLGVGDREWWHWASRAIGLAAALAIYVAYVPPAALRRRFGIFPVTEPPLGRGNVR